MAKRRSKKAAAVLGVAEDTTDEQVQKAYRALMLRHHPDRCGGTDSAKRRAAEIAEAYAEMQGRGEPDNTTALVHGQLTALLLSTLAVLEDRKQDPCEEDVLECMRSSVRQRVEQLDNCLFNTRAKLKKQQRMAGRFKVRDEADENVFERAVRVALEGTQTEIDNLEREVEVVKAVGAYLDRTEYKQDEKAAKSPQPRKWTLQDIIGGSVYKS